MRVLYDMTATKVGSGGVARYVTDLSVALARESGLEIVRIGLSPDHGAGMLGRSAQTLGRRLFNSPLLLKKRANKAGADVVHCPEPRVARAVDQPLVVTIHDLLPWRCPEYFGRRQLVKEKLQIKRSAQLADRIIVSSPYTRDEVVEFLGIPEARISITSWGLDPRFQPVQSSSMWFARRFGIPGPYVLGSGTREPHKNLTVLVRAFEKFQLQHPEYSLVVIGDRPESGSAIEDVLNQSTARVVRPGFVSDEELVRLYSGAACFVFPSLYEGFGFPPIEAMACGTPVISSDRASLPGTVGDAAELVDPTDMDLLVEAMTKVTSRPRVADALRERGRERARTFNWARCASATAEVYRETLAESRR